MSSQYLRLFVQCSGLQPNLFEPCNAMVVLFLQKPDGLYTELTRTDIVRSDMNPHFTKSMLIDREHIENVSKVKNPFGMIEYKQVLRFVVFNVSKGDILDHQTVLGSCDCSIIMITGKCAFTLKIGPRNYGQIILLSEPVEPLSKDVKVSFSFACKDMPRLDIVSLSDPFFQITRRIGSSGEFQPIYTAEARMNTSQPIWKPMEMYLGHFCNGNLQCNLYIQFFDWDGPESRTEIGFVKLKPKDLINSNPVKIQLASSIKHDKESIFYTLDRKMEYKGDLGQKLEDIEAELLKNSVEEEERPSIVRSECRIL